MKLRLTGFAFFFLILLAKGVRAQNATMASSETTTTLLADAPDLGQYPAPLPPALLPLINPAPLATLQPSDSGRSSDGPEAPQLSGEIRMQYARLYFEKMSQHRKSRIEITLRDGAKIEGRLVAVSADRFTIRNASTKQEISLNFADLRDWQLVPANDRIALNVLEAAGMELLEIAMLPLTIWRLLPGSHGC